MSRHGSSGIRRVYRIAIITTEPMASRTPLYASGSRTSVPYFITAKFMPQMMDMSTNRPSVMRTSFFAAAGIR